MKTRTKAKKQAISDYAYIDEERSQKLRRVYKIVDQHSLTYSDASVFDESFIYNLTNACYRLVEDGAVDRQKELKVDLLFTYIYTCLS